MAHESPNIDKSHDWYLPEGMLNRRCRKCGAYAHLGSGFCPCPKADAIRHQVDLLKAAWLKYGYNDDVTVRLFNGLLEIRKEELENGKT